MTNITADAKALIGKADKLRIQADDKYGELVITSVEKHAEAGEALKVVRKQIRDVEAKEKELLAPNKESIAKIKEFFASPISKLKETKNMITSGMLKWEDEAEKVRLAEQLKKQEEADKEARRLEGIAKRTKDPEKKMELQEQATDTQINVDLVKSNVAQVSGVKTQTRWKFEIIDESLIPREYLMIDEVKIGTVVRATKGTLPIAGVKAISYKNKA